MCEICVGYSNTILANRIVPQINLVGSVENLTRDQPWTSTVATTNGFLRLLYFKARNSILASTVSAITGATPAVTPTLIRYGLYAIDVNGDGTLIASTPNDTTLFVASTTYTKALTAPIAVQSGQLYASGWLIVGAATAPTLNGVSSLGVNTENAMTSRLTGHLAGLSDLPASFTDASLASSNAAAYSRLNP